MSHLKIKSDEAHRLASELAAARGSNLTEAVTAALGASLRQTAPPGTGADALLAEVRQVQALVAALPDLDEREPDTILGYGEQGLPS
jgi:antitoxin VapB